MPPPTYVFVWKGQSLANLNLESVMRAISDATGIHFNDTVKMKVVLYSTGVIVTSLTLGQVYRLVPVAEEEAEE
ncbi:hypothetical protein A3H26_01625 [candidate division WWE3 bacterium RIFCSPLOWO2_12_FULL_36_10]|uniref:Uncharacterized protein n=1 Tax=candidate division WWE3 bacterium RIFCSPLOWO2_12_FULL_36_10 TaxID=1802630 RepID=A0A1F4VIJ2_UNCKA|nr:MAG: hypothetical protein A3H26_01625 [candidate division WWE3 bacterium RIFCSPLOWO2_12_FULL_36_10]